MNRTIRRLAADVAAAAFLLAALTHAALPAMAAEPAKPKPLFDDKILARGQGFEVTSSQVEDEFLAFKMDMAAGGRTVQEGQRSEFEARILDRLIITHTLLGRATPADKAKAEELTAKIVSDSQTQAGSEANFLRQLHARGLTAEGFRRRLLERIAAEEVFNREVKAKITIPEEPIRKYYDENPDRFKQPEMARVRHILKMTIDPALVGAPNANPELPEPVRKAKREEIEGLLRKVKAGADFAKLAKETSDDAPSRESGGELTFPRGLMSAEFEAVSFSLKPDQISEVVKSKFGYHIIQGMEKVPAQKVEFEKVKDRIREMLVQQECDKQMPAFVEQAKKEAKVEILTNTPPTKP
jgi:peptidyl-prolyl cis-trans isomerase C